MTKITAYCQQWFPGGSPFSDDLLASLYYKWLPILAIIFGVYLRAREYLFNRSLWLDEAFIAANFVDRSLADLLTTPLDYGHVVPPVFLVVTKLVISTLGVSDLTLRLFPFICGLLSLFLFYFLARSYLTKLAVPIAVVLFTLSEPLIYYSAEFKPYSSDVTAGIALLLLARYLDNRAFDRRSAILFSLAGGLAILFSLPSVFILFPVGLQLMISRVYRKNWESAWLIFASGIPMLGIFAALYFQYIHGLQDSDVGKWVTEWFNLVSAFMPTPLTADWFGWLYDHIVRFSDYILAPIPSAMAAILLVTGVFTFVIVHRSLLSFTLGPFLVVCVVSYFQFYPVYDRMILFLSPIVCLLMAESTARIRFTLPLGKNPPVYLYYYVVALVYLVSVTVIYQPRVGQEMKPVLQYLQENKKTMDKIYLYHWVEPAFRFYASDYGMDYSRCSLINAIPENSFTKEIDHFRSAHNKQATQSALTTCVLGVSESYSQSVADLDKLQGEGNVWFIFSHIGDEKPKFLSHLDSIGTRLKENLQPGASAYLYRL